MTEITKTNPKAEIVMPLVTGDQAVAAFQAYQDLASKIVTDDDVQKIGDKNFKKKSFWRKCQRFFNLSLELVKEWKEKEGQSYTYFVIYRAKAPNGAFMDGDGACTSNEKGRVRTEHDTRSTAHTRAKNRAISDLVAFGEVSAEEVDDSNGNGHHTHTEEAKMTDFQKDIRIYGSGAKLGKSKDQLDAYIMSHLDEDWPDYSKITISRANKIADALEKMVKDQVIEGEEVEE